MVRLIRHLDPELMPYFSLTWTSLKIRLTGGRHLNPSDFVKTITRLNQLAVILEEPAHDSFVCTGRRPFTFIGGKRHDDLSADPALKPSPACFVKRIQIGGSGTAARTLSPPPSCRRP